MPIITCVVCNRQFTGLAIRKYCSPACSCEVRKERARDRTYRSWRAAYCRCMIPKTKHFASYGGRGIKLHEKWLSFDAFYADMGPRPIGMTLDRIDTNGDYAPGNCRWADEETQKNNTRSIRWITHNGETLSASQWARRLGVRVTVIYGRLSYGWSHGDAVTIPSIPKDAKRPKRNLLRDA